MSVGSAENGAGVDCFEGAGPVENLQDGGGLVVVVGEEGGGHAK